jgi:hypothetical protein
LISARPAREIDAARGGGILRLEQAGEPGLQGLALLHPDPVGDVELDRVPLGLGQGLAQLGRGGGDLLAVVGHA